MVLLSSSLGDLEPSLYTLHMAGGLSLPLLTRSQPQWFIFPFFLTWWLLGPDTELV